MGSEENRACFRARRVCRGHMRGTAPRAVGRNTGFWLEAQRRALRGIDALAPRLRGGGQGPAAHLATGLRGEEEALFHLRGLGYTIVDRRWTSPRARGDADLIGWDGEWLCFIEVKTRTGRDWVPAGVRGRWSEAGDAAAAGAGVSEGISGGAAAKLSGAVRCGFGVSHDAGGRN